MREFFRTHICFQLCEKLGLQKVDNDMDENIAKTFYKNVEIFTIVEGAEDNENNLESKCQDLLNTL